MEVKIVTTKRERELVYKIRKKVFVEEQHVPIEEEIDTHEEEAIHFICYHNEKPIGASRLRFVENYGKLERICVLRISWAIIWQKNYCQNGKNNNKTQL